MVHMGPSDRKRARVKSKIGIPIHINVYIYNKYIYIYIYIYICCVYRFDSLINVLVIFMRSSESGIHGHGSIWFTWFHVVHMDLYGALVYTVLMDSYGPHGCIWSTWIHMVHMDPYGAHGCMSCTLFYMVHMDPYGPYGSIQCTWIHTVHIDPIIGVLYKDYKESVYINILIKNTNIY